MKKLIPLTFLWCSLSWAGTITLFDRPMSDLPSFVYTDVSFGVDAASQEGYVLFENLGTGIPDVCPLSGASVCRISGSGLRVVTREKLAVNGLSLQKSVLRYDSGERVIDCAVMKKTRILRRKILKSTGLCTINSGVETIDGERRFVVTMSY